MSLVRWLRKNNTKIMAVVVIVLMVGFIGGSYIQQFSRRTGSPKETIAYFGQKNKITHNDIIQAQQELEILKIVHADAILRSQDLRTLLLGELLFPEQTVSAEMVNQIKELIRRSGYRISEKQINDIYRITMPASNYWLLLKKEVETAGFRIPKDEAGQVLAMTTPKLFEGASYQQLVSSLMQKGISEDEILSAFSNLLAIIQYARVSCANENLTSSQITHNISRDEEQMDIEFVRFDSSLFTKDVAEPQPQQIEEQFNAYKTFFAGDTSEQNPYGFGYKLPDRVQLEYLAVALDEVAKIIPAPSNQEMEEYYQRNIQDFTMSYQSDPNDPNSPVIKKPRTYGEVADMILKMLLRNRTASKADEIIYQAKELIEAKLQTSGTEAEKLTTEKLKELAGDYEVAAKQLGERNAIKIYAGKTGLLSAIDMQIDELLASSYVSTYKSNPVSLTKLAFAVDELGVSELGPFDQAKPKLYENIGPVNCMTKKLTMLVRIIDAEKASVPETGDLTFNNTVIAIESDANVPSEKVYSVSKIVSEDLKKIAAMDIAKTKAQEFIDSAQKDGWDSTVQEFNTLYGQSDKNEPNAIKLQHLPELGRLSKSLLKILAAGNAGDPTGRERLRQTDKQYLLLEKFYSLIPTDSTEAADLASPVEFKPNASYYCMKNLTVKRLTTVEYEKLKARAVYNEDFAQSQAMAAVHFNPENIVKRMNFRWVKTDIQLIRPDESLPEPMEDF